MLTVPAHLMDAFRAFRRDFDWVTTTWIARREETEQSVEAMRAGVRELLALPSSPERNEKLGHMFDFWAALARRICPDGAVIVPEFAISSKRNNTGA